jgi:hypothetical protein
MVRGTYFPWPYPEKLLLDGMIMSVDFVSVPSHTGLGEEGAETLIGLLGLALFSQVSIGLYQNLSARSREPAFVVEQRTCIPGYRVQGSRAVWMSVPRVLLL